MKTFLIFFFPPSFFIHHFCSLLNIVTQWMKNEWELFALLVVANEMKWEFFPSVCSVGVCFIFAIFSLASSVILIATCYMIMAFVSSKTAHRMCGELFWIWSGFNCRAVSCSSAQITLTLIQSAHLSRNNHLNPHRMCTYTREDDFEWIVVIVAVELGKWKITCYSDNCRSMSPKNLESPSSTCGAW